MTAEQSVQVRFAPSFSGVSVDAQHVEATCEVPWDPAWFGRPSSSFDARLAAASMALAMAAWDNTAKNECCYMREALAGFGFQDADVQAFAHRNAHDGSDFERDADLVAYGMAHRLVRDAGGREVPLVALVVRGTSHTREWASDANVASDVSDGNYNVEYHEGFDAAADEAYGHLARYLVHHGIDMHSARMWIVGHSRGGAVANLVGAFMCESGEFDPANVFVYGFATPPVTRRKDAADERFAGIFNVVDPEDLIVRMPLASWGFRRFGSTFYLPSPCTASAAPAGYFERAAALYQQFTGTERPAFGSLGPVLQMEGLIGGLCPTLATAYQKERLTKLGRTTFAQLFSDLMAMNGESGGKKAADAMKVGRFAAGPFWPLLKRFAKDSAMKHARSGAHAQEGYLARVIAATEAGVDLPASPAVRITCFTVHGDVDVAVKDVHGAKVASVWKGAVERVGDVPGALPIFYDDELKATSVWLPHGSLDDHRIELRDRDGRSFGVTIAEQDPMGYTLSQDEYGPVKIGAGHTLPWSELAPKVEVRHASHGRNLRVTVRTQGAKRCDAVGAVCLTAGDWAVAHAYEGLGVTFKGWYAEGRNPKVAKPDSTARAYRMRVAEDRSLVAVFD